ncbi:GTPase [Georgenia subflava]|nr:GTPase [Georgenia subflava]
MTTPSPIDLSEADSPRHPRLEVITDLQTEVSKVAFPLDLPDAPELRELRERVLTQLGARLLPRLRRADAPAVVVLGGSSGVGKSTLLNSLLGEEVSDAGVLRPTTRRAVVAVHPDDAASLVGQPLADLADVRTHPAVPAGLALLDAPDLNSVHADNRSLAAQLLETADLWVFVTTAARYGDALPWRLLTEANARGISTAVVLNRVPARVLGPVRKDLLSRLDGLGLGEAPLFLVPDAGPHEGTLPGDLVTELDAWLDLVADRHRAAGVVRRTTRGVWAALREQLLVLAAGADDQAEAAAALRDLAVAAAGVPAEAVRTALSEGRAGLGAPTTVWLSLASTGGPLARLAHDGAPARGGWRGRRLAAREEAAAQLADEVAAALQMVLASAVRAADTALRQAWRAPELGAGDLLARTGATAERSDPAARAEDAVRAWAEQVRKDTAADATRSTEALDAAGLAALVQAGAAGVSGASDAARRLLGDATAVERARTDLLDRAEDAVRGAVEPYLDALDALGPAGGTGLRLRASELREHA